LEIDSEVGSGTEVKILLPVSEQRGAPEKKADMAREDHEGGEHILVVDDETAVTQILSIWLKQRGFTVTTFNEVGEAQDSVAATPTLYDLAILDFAMPGKTGIELAQEFYTLNPNLPVVISSGLVDNASIDFARHPNAVEALSKPFNVDALLGVIQRVV
jgi:two-component system cell cycle sensor histidine kinase/response regulator CckA